MILLLATFFTLNIAKPIPAATDSGRMLDAIAAVETGNDYRKVGRAGEVTAFQIMPRYWHLHTSAPITRGSTDESLGRLVASRHLAQLRRELIGFRLAVTPYNLALAWRAGSPAVAHKKATPHQRDHAQRIVNLYEKPTP